MEQSKEMARIAAAIEAALLESGIVNALMTGLGISEDRDLLDAAAEDDAQWAEDDFQGQELREYVDDDDYPQMQRLGLIWLMHLDRPDDIIRQTQAQTQAQIEAETHAQAQSTARPGSAAQAAESMVNAIEATVGDTRECMWKVLNVAAEGRSLRQLLLLTHRQQNENSNDNDNDEPTDRARKHRILQAALAIASIASPVVLRRAEAKPTGVAGGVATAAGAAAWSNGVDVVHNSLGIMCVTYICVCVCVCRIHVWMGV
jgi:hypothetical protein